MFAKEIRASRLKSATNRSACLVYILSLPAFAELDFWQTNTCPGLQSFQAVSRDRSLKAHRWRSHGQPDGVGDRLPGPWTPDAQDVLQRRTAANQVARDEED